MTYLSPITLRTVLSIPVVLAVCCILGGAPQVAAQQAEQSPAAGGAKQRFAGQPLEYWVTQARTVGTEDAAGAKEVVAALAEAVLCDVPLTKVAAADALAGLGPRAIGAVPALLAQLGHEQPWVRSAVMGALAAVGPEAVQPLIDTFENQTGGPRIRAAFVLGGMGDVAKPAIPALVKAMEAESPVVQKRLADILAQIDPEQFAGNTTNVESLREAIALEQDVLEVRSAEWPQFNGPLRDRICRERGLLQSWPEGGPKQLWVMEGLGRGFSSISIAGGRIFTMGDLPQADGTEAQFVIAFDLNSHERQWATKIGAPFGTGPRCTPTIDGDRAYALGTEGDLVCLDAATGTKVWQKNLAQDFGGKMMSVWMYSESPLVDGEQVICTPGGETAQMVALNKLTGEVIWTCAVPPLGDLGADGAGYSSPIVATIEGTRQYIQLTGRGVVGVDAASGEFLWGYNRIANNVANIPTPIARGPYVFVSTAYSTGSALLKIARDNDAWQANEVYFLGPRDFQNHHGGMVLVGNYIYGGSGPNKGFPTCIDVTTGKVCWQERAPALGSAAVLYADGQLIFRYDRGEVVLIEATPEEMHVTGRFTPVTDEGPAWAHPVIYQGRLYLRHGNLLGCYDVRSLE